MAIFLSVVESYGCLLFIPLSQRWFFPHNQVNRLFMSKNIPSVEGGAKGYVTAIRTQAADFMTSTQPV